MSSFVLLGEFIVPPKTFLVQGACNPEKDLVLLIHRSDSRDTLSLWKLQGSKRWEVDVVGNFNTTSSLRDVSWSPDGAFLNLTRRSLPLIVIQVISLPLVTPSNVSLYTMSLMVVRSFGTTKPLQLVSNPK